MIMLLILLLIYGIFIFGFAVALRKIGIPRHSMLFAGFALFGILSGLVAALYGHHEGQYIYNIPGVLVGEEIYTYAIDHFGDPHSAFAHYTIPWVLRIPQVVLLTSAIVWGLIGLIAQLIYNTVKKTPPLAKGITTLLIVASLIACLGVAGGVVYATQDESERSGPTQPTAYPLIEVGTLPTPEWGTIATYELESLSLSSKIIRIGEHLDVTGVVKNTGPKRGIAQVELKVDGKVLSSQEVALLPEESKPVKFVIFVPRQGSYTVRMGNLIDSFEVRNQ